MQVKQCRCGGAMIEVPNDDVAVLCGGPYCGEPWHRTLFREISAIAAGHTFILPRAPDYRRVPPDRRPDEFSYADALAQNADVVLHISIKPPEAAPLVVFNNNRVLKDRDGAVGGLYSPQQRHAASLTKECDMAAALSGSRREFIIDIVKRKLEEGRADFLADISLEFIAERRRELVMAPSPKNVAIQDEAIPLILRTLEGMPEHRVKFEKLASAYKELLRFEEAACPSPLKT